MSDTKPITSKLGIGVAAANHHVGVKRLRIAYKKLREPLLTVLLAFQIFILFVMPCLRAMGFHISHNIVYWFLLIFAALATLLSRSRKAMVMMIISIILSIAGIIWHNEQPDFLTDAISGTGQVLTQISLLWAVSSAVFGPGRTTYHRVLGAVVMYLGIGMIFTSLDIFLARTIPDAFTGLPADSAALREALTYFNFSALTTSGFGDIVPMHPIARSLANIESICGQLFPATLLARLVGFHGAKDSKKREGIGL